MGRLQADLKVVGNALRFPLGRPLLVGTLVTITFLGCLSALIGAALLSNPKIIELLIGGDAQRLRFRLFGFCLFPSVLVALWFGLSASTRLLFEGKDRELFLSAPLAPWSIVRHDFARVWALTTLYGTALCGPVLWMVLAQSEAPWWCTFAVPLLVALGTAPWLSTVMAVYVVAMRWFAGRVLRVLIVLVGTTASVAFSLLLLFGAFARGPEVAKLAEAIRGDLPLPRMIDGAGNLLALAIGAPWHHDAVLRGLGALLLGALLLYLVAPWYPRARENHAMAPRMVFRPWGKRAWPESVVASICRKEIAQFLQQPRQLIGLLLFGVMLFVLASKGLIVDGVLAEASVPLQVRQWTAMLGLWALGSLMVMPGSFGRFTLADGMQWPLYTAAPLRPVTLLAGKCLALFVLMLWPVVVVAFIGWKVFGAQAVTVLAFVPLALCGTLIALAMLAVLGTIPFLMRPDEDGQLAHGGRSMLAVFLMVLLYELAFLPTYLGWLAVVRSARQGQTEWIGEPWLVWTLLLLGMAALGMIALGGGILVASRNLRKLLEAR